MPSPSSRSRTSSSLEIGTLYGTSAAYGVGLGLWLDAEIGIEDPGVQFIAPVLLGAALPVGVYFLDNPAMRVGEPAIISAGILIGAGEGIGIWWYQFTSNTSENAWGFRGATRALSLGGLAGGAVGMTWAFLDAPSPKTTVFAGSGTLIGSAMGSMIGFGATTKGAKAGDVNEWGVLGGLIGYNVGLVATAGASFAYVPSWATIGWMWLGAAAGGVLGLPIYLAYAGSDAPAKRGLIIHATLIGIGTAAGTIFSSHLSDGFAKAPSATPKMAEITGLGLMPVQNGMGVQLVGSLF